MNGKWLYVIILGFTLGIGTRSFFPVSNSSILGDVFVFSLFLLSISIILLFFCTIRKTRGASYQNTLVLTLIFFSASVGVARFDSADINKGDSRLDTYIEKHVDAVGIVVDEPDERENNTRLTVLLKTVSKKTVRGKTTITTNTYPRYSYGDEIRMEGTLKKPRAFAGEDGNVFDYPAFLAKNDIFYQMFFPNITTISTGKGNVIKKTLFDIKRAWRINVERVIPDPHVSLLGGLVVGAKQSLGEKLQDDFRRTGIIHIVVLSGYNVTIVAEAIMRFFSFLPGPLKTTFGVTSIVFFALLTGAGATVVRASIMALLVILARSTGRTYLITRALFIAGFLMILHNPKILVFDSSFQLSFVATLGLIYLAPKIENYFGWMPTKWQLREFATATVATQLFVLPMILYKMGDLSLVALPVNILVLALIPLTMLLGFLTGVIGFVSTLLSMPFGFITYGLLWYQLKVVDIFASFPFASVHIDSFPLWLAVLSYAGFATLIWKLHKK